MKRVLIVDDDRATSAGMADVVEEWGYEPEVADTVKAGWAAISKLVPDVAIVDLKLPDGSGLDLLHKIKETYPDVSVIILTGHATVDSAVKALKVGADTIHSLSRRRMKPFIAFNCGAISPTLIESEIFGHEKGAFTNAIKRREGYFELAKGGTVFLDEITEMPIELQVKLLRVLEEGKFRRVGGNHEINIDARIIAASNRDPQKAIVDGRMREDLYYRLNVFPIEVPPLRQRLEDIPLFSYFFLEKLNETEDKKVDRIEPGFIEALQQYEWPGNVRELRNVINRAFIMARSS